MLLISLCSVYLVGGIFVSIFNEKNNLNYLFHSSPKEGKLGRLDSAREKIKISTGVHFVKYYYHSISAPCTSMTRPNFNFPFTNQKVL